MDGRYMNEPKTKSEGSFINHIDGDPRNNDIDNLELKYGKPRDPIGDDADAAAYSLYGRRSDSRPAIQQIPPPQRWNGRGASKTVSGIALAPQGGTLLCACETQAVIVRALCLRHGRTDIEVKVMPSEAEITPDPNVQIALQAVVDDHKVMQYFPSDDPHAQRALREDVPRVVAKSRNFHELHDMSRKLEQK